MCSSKVFVWITLEYDGWDGTVSIFHVSTTQRYSMILLMILDPFGVDQLLSLARLILLVEFLIGMNISAAEGVLNPMIAHTVNGRMGVALHWGPGVTISGLFCYHINQLWRLIVIFFHNTIW